MKKNYFLLLFLLSNLITLSISAQNLPQWKAYYRGNGDNEDRYHKIIPDGSGGGVNFICVGYTVKSGNHKDILTAKVNALTLDTMWWKTKNGKGNGDDVGMSAGVDASGNIYVVGTVDGGNSQNDIMVIKYDANGVVQWDTTWNNPSAFLDDVAVDIKVDAAGNSYIGGNTEPDTFSGNNDFVTLKFATDGTLLWANTFSNSLSAHGKDELAAIALDDTQNVFVTGRSFGGTNDNFATLKYASDGTFRWNAPYNAGANDRAACIVVDHSGNVIVSGRSDNGSDYDFRTIKYDNYLGTIKWTRFYDCPAQQDDKPVAIGVDALNNVYVAGYADVDNGPGIDNNYELVKWDSAGTQQGSARYGSPFSLDDEPSDMVVDNAGNVYITGKADQSVTPGSTDYDWMTMKYNSSLSVQWNSSPMYHSGTYPGGDDYAMSLVLYNDTLYVAGGTRNTGTQKDATVVKYDVFLGTEILYKDHNGSGDFSESARSIVVDGSNNSYVTGYTYGEGQNLNGFISRFDPAGTLLCTIIYNGLKDDDDELNQIAISGNNVYACGYTKVTGQKSNMLLIKYDISVCDTAWTRTYDFIGQSDKAESLVVDGSGNIYVTGRSDSDPNDTLNNEDVVTIKYDSGGNQVWASPIRYDGPSHLKDEPVKIILDHAGNVLVGGRTKNTQDDILILKYDATGAPVSGFPVIYDSQFTYDDRLSDITVDANDNIFVTGSAQTGPTPSTDDPLVIKYASTGGAPAGFNSYSAFGHDEATKVVVDGNNDVFVLYKYDTQPGLVTNTYSLQVKKFSNNLPTPEIWTAQYDSPIFNDVVPADLKMDTHGNVFATGTVDNNLNGTTVNRNWITLGYGTSGNSIFTSNEDGPNQTDDSPNALIISADYMWVCGYTAGTGNEQRDATVYLYNILGVGLKTPDLVSSNAYPNPFVNECEINVSDAITAQDMILSVYDMIGNLVTAPIHFSGNKVHLQKGNLSSGFYEYKITNDGAAIARGKLVVE